MILEVACPVSQLSLLFLSCKTCGWPCHGQRAELSRAWGCTLGLSLKLKGGPLPEMSVPEAASAGQRAFCVLLWRLRKCKPCRGLSRSGGMLGKQCSFPAFALGVKSRDMVRKGNFFCIFTIASLFSPKSNPSESPLEICDA